MPKPFMGVSANGCHHNISLWRGDENAFLPDTDDVHKPSEIGLYAIGGILEHLRALTARHRADGQLVPPPLGHGLLGAGLRRLGLPEPHDRTARLVARPLRVPLGRLCSQSVPGAGGADQGRWTTGSSASSTRASPRSGNIYEAIEAGKEVKRVPMTLGEALEALEADEVVKSALPGEMYRVFMHYKRDEWERYCATVTDLDRDEYLDVLP